MAFNRVLDIYVGYGIGDKIVVDPSMVVGKGQMVQLASGSTLHADAEIKRSNRMDRNTATVRIYNLNPKFRAWLEAPGKVIRIDAGYEDEGHGAVFYGQIDKAFSNIEGQADWVTTIYAYQFRSRGMDFEGLPVALSYDADTTVQTYLSDLASVLGVPLLGENVSDIILDGGIVTVTTMKRALDRAMKTLQYYGYGMFYDLAELFVYKASKAVTTLPTVNFVEGRGLLSAKWVIHEKRNWRMDVRTKSALKKAREAYDKAKTADGKTRASQNLKYTKYLLGEAHRDRVEMTSLVDHRARPNCPCLVWHSAVSRSKPKAGEKIPAKDLPLFVIDDITLRLSNYGKSFDMVVYASKEQDSVGA